MCLFVVPPLSAWETSQQVSPWICCSNGITKRQHYKSQHQCILIPQFYMLNPKCNCTLVLTCLVLWYSMAHWLVRCCIIKKNNNSYACNNNGDLIYPDKQLRSVIGHLGTFIANSCLFFCCWWLTELVDALLNTLNTGATATWEQLSTPKVKVANVWPKSWQKKKKETQYI